MIRLRLPQSRILLQFLAGNFTMPSLMVEVTNMVEGDGLGDSGGDGGDEYGGARATARVIGQVMGVWR